MDFTDLYRYFGRYEKPLTMSVYSGSLNISELNALLEVELKSITAEQISVYASNGMFSGGSENDYFYFFPRIFEVCLTDKSFWPNPELIYQAILNSGWKSWDIKAKSMVLSLTREKFCCVLAEGADGSIIDQWLCAAAHIDELDVYMSQLENEKNITSFTRLIEWNFEYYTSQHLQSEHFWGAIPERAAKFEAWLLSERVRDYLQASYGFEAQ